jgi:hypothetical protein
LLYLNLMSSSKNQKKEFRGLTIFELAIIIAVILSSVLWALSFRSGLRNETFDAQRKGRVSTVSEYLKVYFLQKGSFPGVDDFEDEETRKIIFRTLLAEEGDDFLNDPKDKNILISYSSEPFGCSPETELICNRASAGLFLSNREEFVRFAFEPGKEAEILQELNVEAGEDRTTQDILRELESELEAGE